MAKNLSAQAASQTHIRSKNQLTRQLSVDFVGETVKLCVTNTPSRSSRMFQPFLVRLAICCVVLLATSLEMQAQASFGTSVCSSQAITGQGPVYYQIKGTTSVNSIPQNTMNVSVTFKFMKETTPGNFTLDFSSPPISLSPAGGAPSLNFDSGFITFTPTKGTKYRILVDGSYIDNSVPAVSTTLASGMSFTITPYP